MFLFNKPKKRLEDLIPDGYTDIHSHLLPGIDDGAKDEQNTIELINALKNYGFSQFITTPHILSGVWNNTKSGIVAKESDTKKVLDREGISNPFKAAAEYMMDETFIKLIKNEPLLTIKENYVLVEMSYLNPPIQLYDILFELQVAGYTPILAHPERYLFYHQKFEEYGKLKKAGCLLQLNLLSVTGYYGKHVAEVSNKLLENDMINFTGSDVHHNRHIAAFKNKVLLKKYDKLEAAINKNTFFNV